MPIDPEVENAISEVCVLAKQPEKLAKRLIAWLNDVSDRELGPEEEYQHLSAVKDAVRVDEESVG